MQSRHIIAIMLDEYCMSLLFQEGATVRCVSGMPRDAKLLGVHADFYRQCFVATFEHESFPPCLPGCEPERRYLGYEVLEHPDALHYDMVPVRVGMNEREFLDMRRWVKERAKALEAMGL